MVPMGTARFDAGKIEMPYQRNANGPSGKDLRKRQAAAARARMAAAEARKAGSSGEVTGRMAA